MRSLFYSFFLLVGWLVEGACGWIPELVFGWLGVVVLADHLTLGDTTSSYTDYLFLLFTFFLLMFLSEGCLSCQAPGGCPQGGWEDLGLDAQDYLSACWLFVSCFVVLSAWPLLYGVGWEGALRGVCLVWVESSTVSFGLRRGARDEISLLTVNTPYLTSPFRMSVVCCYCPGRGREGACRG